MTSVEVLDYFARLDRAVRTPVVAGDDHAITLYNQGVLCSQGHADAVLAAMLAETTFVRDRANGAVARRLTCAFGQPGLCYRYSGTTKIPGPWPPLVEGLARETAVLTGVEFNFCLANLYPDHTATLGWHADDERDLEPDAPIAIVSLGSTRLLGLQRVSDGWTTSVPLTHGSLLVMAGATQRLFKHCIARGVRGDGPRVSLTLRRVRASVG